MPSPPGPDVSSRNVSSPTASGQTHICTIEHLFIICHASRMSRISIDVSDEEHRKLKAMAALKGQSLKDFMLQRTLGKEAESDQDAALVELVEFLDARVHRAEKEGVSTRTVGEIFRQARHEAKVGKNGGLPTDSRSR